MTGSTPYQVRVKLTAPQAVPDTSAIVWPGQDPGAAAVILAHGAGTDMTHPHTRRHATDLAAAGHATALFNFAYSEVGRRRPDPPTRLLSAWTDVINALHPQLGRERRLIVGGRSMGGRLASMLAAQAAQELHIDGIACLAYPLHPPGRPDNLRVDHWPDLTTPILFVTGSRDPMAPAEVLRRCVDRHMAEGLATIHVVAGADHSYRVRKADGRTEDEVLAEAATAVREWLVDLSRRT